MVAALSELAGIKSEDIEVNLDRDAFTIDYESSLVTLDEMYAAIFNLGYSPGLEETESTSSPDGAPGGIPEPIASSLAEAAGSNKLVLVDFYAEWCAACKLLEETALTDPSVTNALENYIFLKVDTDIYEAAASYYDVLGMPTLLVLNSAGDEIYRFVGLIDPENLALKLDELIQ